MIPRYGWRRHTGVDEERRDAVGIGGDGVGKVVAIHGIHVLLFIGVSRRVEAVGDHRRDGLALAKESARCEKKRR